MKYIRRDLYSNRIIYRKYAKNYHRHNMNILTFLKSNYKYKRRNTQCHHSSGKQKRQLCHLPNRQQKQKYKHKFPVRNDDILADNKQITERNSIYENIKLDKFLRIFILIVQQTTTTTKNNNNICNNQSKDVNSSKLVTRLVAKMKAIKKQKKTNESLTNFNVIDNDRDEVEDGIISEDHHLHHHYAYKDANKDADINIDTSNIVDEISHQQHNYDKVSTITSTPIKCQRRKDHQMKAIKFLSSSSPLSTSTFSLITTKTTPTTTSSPSITNYETCQCSAILRHYDHYNSSYYYHYKIKHVHMQYHQQHHRALHYLKPLMSSEVLNINNNCNNNKSKYINKINEYNNNKGTSSVPVRGTSNNCQSTSAIWKRSYTLSCFLLTLFITLSIGVRSTTAGACWQTVLDNGKCNEIFSLNISKSECCGANQEFAYTEREPTNVEYFFATAIGGGMECSPCLESCKNVKCGPNKKCVKRKGRPKCICAPECGAARRKRKQREYVSPEAQSHTLHLVGTHIRDSRDVENDGDDDDDEADNHDIDGYIADMAATMQFPNAFKIKIEKSQQSRDTRSLSSEITNVNLGLETGKDTMMINSGEMSPIEKRLCKENNENQRKIKYLHMYPTHTQAYDQQQQSQDSNHKNQEPKGSRRLLITANVEYTEKPTTRRLQILSNVRTTHTRRYNSKKNKNEHGPDEDTDPSDYEEALEEEGENKNDKDYKYNDAEDDTKDHKAKNNNGNSNSNKNNRNDDSMRFLNQSMSRHKLKANTKSNNHNSNSNNNKSRNRNSRNNNKKKTQHDLQRTKIQQHSSNNNTRIRHQLQNGRHAENTPHYRHHHQHYSHQQQQQYQAHHRQEQEQQQHNLNHNHQQQSPIHGRHKHNKQQKHNHQQQHHHKHKQQTIVLKIPKNNEDYNITTTTNNISVANKFATYNSHNNNNNNSGNTDATVTATSLTHQSRLGQISTAQTSLNLSSATSSLSSTTPVNSTMSANDDDGAAADDHYHSRLPNHGNRLATSYLSSSTATLPSTSSHLQLSAASARSSQEPSSAATTIVKMFAKGEGVSLHDQNMHHIEMPTKNAYNSGNSKKNNDNIISTFQSNLHNTQQQQDQQHHQHQTQSTQSQQEQQHQHYQTPLFDGLYEQFDLIGFQNKQQQTITTEDNVRPLNPVCGTDARTYNTECQLRKRACRTDNPSLQVSYRGHCKTTCNGVKCLNGLTCVEDQYSKPYCIACKIECPQDDYDNDVVDATRAVCGADGKTYKSICDINRMICNIGRSIGVAYPGPCREEQVTCDDINCGPKQVCLIDLLTHKPRCTTCRYKCSRKRRPSYPYIDEGKICGTNSHTYNSWCEMLKDSCSTGFYIDVKYSGACH